MELEKTTPYMLRYDGELLTCGDIHPYIKQWQTVSLEDNIKQLSQNINYIDWFINNTLNSKTKEILTTLKNKTINNDFENIEKIFEDAAYRTDCEFCRVRTSNFKYKYGGDNGEIYFRLSGSGFNWFDNIWYTVNKFKSYITSVTIMEDKVIRGEKLNFVKINGVEVNKMPVDDFLTIKGKPILEGFNRKYLVKEDIEKHETLNPKLFDGDKLKPEVIEKSNQIVNEFIEDLKQEDIDLKIKDIILTGSNASYNYTKNSDMDIHIVADMSDYTNEEVKELLPKIYDAFRKNWKSKYTIDFYGVPVELYVETYMGDEE